MILTAAPRHVSAIATSPPSNNKVSRRQRSGLTRCAASGPSLHTILDAAGAEPARLRIYAINDYNVEFPAEKITETTPILANRIDGESFSVRQKGPLWVIFPFDQNPEFQSEEIFALSVWQVKRIDVLTD